MKLCISDSLALPLEAVTEKCAFIGRTGSGKTYAAQKLAEEMYHAKAQFVVLDPVGVWYGLRLNADGKGAGLAIPVLGGLRGDIPLEPNGGSLVANLVVDSGASMVLDVGQFESDAAKARFAHDFADRFFFRKKSSPSAVHLFIDEAQEFTPQNPQREEGRMLHAFTRLLKLGRNFGIGASLLSQRPQEVNKKCLNLAELLFAFQLTGPQERKTIDGWIADKGLDEDIAAELPKLERGCPHVWSPSWLKISRVIQIAPRMTFDASSTPKVGKAAASSELAPIDLEKLRTEMAETIERAKSEDPRELKRRIAELERKLAERPKETKEVVVEKIVEVPVLKNGQLEKTEKAAAQAESLGQRFLDEAAALGRIIAPALSKPPVAAPKAVAVAAKPVERPSVDRDRPNGELTGPEQKILDELAELETFGIVPADRGQLALMCGYSNSKSGGFAEPLGNLTKALLASYPSPGFVAITDVGRSLARCNGSPPSTEELQSRILRKLQGPKAKILAAMIAIYPKDVDRNELGQQLGYTNPKSGGFAEPLGDLKALGLVEYPSSGRVRARSILFLGD